MTYAIVKLGGKQHRVREGERLLVDRVKSEEGATLSLTPMLVGGDGETQLAPDGVTVTARVVQHVLGKKIRIGKYKQRTGYRRHTGYRSRLTQIEIEAIGGKTRSRKQAEAADPTEAQEKPKRAAKPKAKAQQAETAAPKGTTTTKKKDES